MSTESIGAGNQPAVDWRRAEFVLTLLAFLGFLTLPIRITTIYGGLPAHPLFVHVPVVLIPCTIVAAIVFVIKPPWLSRYGIALALVSIVAMSSIFLTMQAGAALRGALNLQGQAAKLISEHSQAAHILAYIYVLFTATLIVTFASQRISSGMPTGLGSWTACSPPSRPLPRCASCWCCCRSAPATWSSGPATSARKRCGGVGFRPPTTASPALREACPGCTRRRVAAAGGPKHGRLPGRATASAERASPTFPPRASARPGTAGRSR